MKDQKNDCTNQQDLVQRTAKPLKKTLSARCGRQTPVIFDICDQKDGKTHKVYLMIILDDHSRLIVGGDLFYHDSACNFQKVLKGAVATYGIPTKFIATTARLTTMNSSPSSAARLVFACCTPL